jgi:hypothetical protein
MFFPICLISVNGTVISRSKGSSLTSINTNYARRNQAMKRLILISTFVCIIAVLYLPVSSARGEFATSLFPSNATLQVADGGHGTAVTIFYVGRTVDSDVFTVQPGARQDFVFDRLPRGTRRVIIEVDPSRSEFSTILLISGAFLFSHFCLPDSTTQQFPDGSVATSSSAASCRYVFNVQ